MLDTKEALRVAIANIEAIREYDKNSFDLDLHNCQRVLHKKLLKLITIS